MLCLHKCRWDFIGFRSAPNACYSLLRRIYFLLRQPKREKSKINIFGTKLERSASELVDFESRMNSFVERHHHRHRHSVQRRRDNARFSIHLTSIASAVSIDFLFEFIPCVVSVFRTCLSTDRTYHVLNASLFTCRVCECVRVYRMELSVCLFVNVNNVCHSKMKLNRKIIILRCGYTLSSVVYSVSIIACRIHERQRFYLFSTNRHIPNDHTQHSLRSQF